MSLLEFNDIHRAYKPGEPILAGVSFNLDAGEVVGLLGRNGAGKSTLIHIALGLIHPQRGSVRLFGLDPRTDPVEIKRRVGFVSENQILPPAMRVEQVIEFHRELFPTWDRELERSLRDRFRFGARQRVNALSKGEARQLALLCAVAHRPELLLLDEPGGGLDPAARREFLETGVELLGESGSAILFSSHHMPDVERIAGRVVLLEDRVVLLQGDLDDLREQTVLALMPANGRIDPARLEELEGLVVWREHQGALRAVLRGEPDQVSARLRRQLATEEVCCQTLPLEELFVELVGGRS